MNNEEKIIPETEDSVENIPPEEKAPKKLSTGVLAAIIGGAVLLVAAVVILVVLLAGGSKCKAHVDADDDYKCDNCGVDYDDGDEAPDSTAVNVTFNVKLDNGGAIPGVSFTLTRGDNSYSFVTDENGKVTAALEPGSYRLSCENYRTETQGFKITQDTTSFDFVVSDNENVPDGSADNPFYISEDETEVIIAPGEEIYYLSRRANLTYVKIFVEGIVINYNGQTYTYSNETGSVTMSFESEDNRGTIFSIKNVSTETVETTMKLEAPLGSRDNPMELTESSATASVSEEDMVYYKWTADKNGILVLTSPTARNSISITRTLENDIPIISSTGGNSAAYIVVSTGEEVSISVSVTGSSEKVDVSFSLATYAGTEADPVPVLMDEIDISIDAGASVVFSGNVDETVTISDEENVSIIYNGATYNPDASGKISVNLTDSKIFTVVNNGETINGISIENK